GITDPLGDLLFGQFHRLFALAFSIFKFYNFGRSSTASRNRSATPRLLRSITDLIFSFIAWHTGTLGEIMAIRRLPQWVRRSSGLLFFVLSVQQFKKDVSNSATQNSIMNVQKKTQLTHARINCVLKYSSCDSQLSKILKFTILASNASSSLTKVLKCPHTKNDSIFTHNGSTI
ncbi:hypothetical protein H5410_014913, partial [Solanum commersonii]